MSYTIIIRRTKFEAESLKEISEIFSRERDASGEGASTFPSPYVRLNGKMVGHISYNGRIWDIAKDRVGKLIYDNRTEV